jgi:nitroimidazol reductase NimA-like FMN-containing flavoprotein (pyridoxamine 5'-phosphate oxidase superfamily)
VYEPDYIYVLSTFGQKTEWMRRNPNVCLEVDEITNQSQWMSVIAKGRYEELPEPQFTSERDHARTLLAKRHSWCLNALAERQLKLGDDSIATLFFRIHVDSMTGLCATGESAETGNAAQK